jgi:Lrp/AsnC family leucine-responsive transcriptional regulator
MRWPMVSSGSERWSKGMGSSTRRFTVRSILTGRSPAILRRIQRLKSAGVIDRVVALLNPAKAGRRMKAVVTVELERHGEEYMRRFLELVAAEPAVIQAYSVSGNTDAVLMLRLEDMGESDVLCERLFRIGATSRATTQCS